MAAARRLPPLLNAAAAAATCQHCSSAWGAAAAPLLSASRLRAHAPCGTHFNETMERSAPRGAPCMAQGATAPGWAGVAGRTPSPAQAACPNLLHSASSPIPPSRSQRLHSLFSSPPLPLPSCTVSLSLSFSFSSSASASSQEEQVREQLNRLLYRSKQRGVLELDLLLGRWADKHAAHLDPGGLQDLAALLDHESPDLLQWLIGQATPPPTVAKNQVFVSLRSDIASQLSHHSNPASRASPGAPWVKGWDDFKNTKTVGLPPGGNQ